MDKDKIRAFALQEIQSGRYKLKKRCGAEVKQFEEALDTASRVAGEIYDLAWASDQALLQNSDMTISPIELQSRVATLVGVIMEKSHNLHEYLGGGYRNDNDQ